jgi:predicted transcriptional regulator
VILRESMSLKEFGELKGKGGSHKRGYLYVYSSRSLEEIKSYFRELLDRWYESMKNYIETLDTTFNCFEKNGELC